jgi:hypothetical protein
MRTPLTVACLLLGAHLAAADPTPAAPPAGAGTSDCARARTAGKVCVLTIEDEKIEGSTPTGDGVSALAMTFARAGSLIRVRRDFIAEILKTAEDL